MLASNSSLSGNGEKVGECWESSVGQELAKLILFDMYMVTFSAGSEKHSPLEVGRNRQLWRICTTVRFAHINLMTEYDSTHPLITT